jgi:hypothetical protein
MWTVHFLSTTRVYLFSSCGCCLFLPVQGQGRQQQNWHVFRVALAQKFTENRAINGDSPKSSTLIGCSIINHPAIGVPLWLWKASDVQESLFSRVTFNASVVNWSCSRRFTWQRFGTIYIKHPTELWKHKRLQLTGTACLSPGKF